MYKMQELPKVYRVVLSLSITLNYVRLFRSVAGLVSKVKRKLIKLFFRFR